MAATSVEMPAGLTNSGIFRRPLRRSYANRGPALRVGVQPVACRPAPAVTAAPLAPPRPRRVHLGSPHYCKENLHHRHVRLLPVKSSASHAGGGAGSTGDSGANDTSSSAYNSKQQTPADNNAGSTPAATGNTFPPGFTSRRLLCFIGITLGYMGLYLTRGSLTYAAPVMVADKSMGITMTHIGAITSAFPLAYGISKFTGGLLGTRFSPRLMLGGGLLATAVFNLAVGLPWVGVTALTVLWALNGSLQGIGAPASAALLTRWFASSERGTWWSLWNVGANLGGFFTPVVVGHVAQAYGWRLGMVLPGLAGLVIALFTLAVVKDSPEAAGFPSPEAPTPKKGAAESSEAPEKKPSIRDALVQVLKNPGIWLLAFTYFFVYIVRQGATSWLQFYLVQQKGAVDAAHAARTVSGLELGGLVGGTLAGYLSDVLIRNAPTEPGKAGHVGRRVRVVMGYVVIIALVLLAIRAAPASSPLLQWLAIAGLGFGIYGPHMLIGLCGAELVDKPAVGASQGVLGLVSYLGAANAGLPLSWVVQNHGWDGYFIAMACACVGALLLLAPLANARSFLQKQEQERHGP